MSSIIDLRTYVGASSGRLLVMVDLQEKNYDALTKDNASGLSRSLDNCLSAIRHARNFGIPIAFTRHSGEGLQHGIRPHRTGETQLLCIPGTHLGEGAETIILGTCHRAAEMPGAVEMPDIAWRHARRRCKILATSQRHGRLCTNAPGSP